VKLRHFYRHLKNTSLSDLRELSLVQLKDLSIRVAKGKEEAWAEATKANAAMKAIKNNKLYRDTYTNAFKGLTEQLKRSFEGFNKRMEAAK
jgi:hypothetical protein